MYKESFEERNGINFFNSKCRDKTPGKHPKVDGSPKAKIKPTPIGPVTVTGEKPTPIGTVTKIDTKNCATEPVTTKNPIRIKPKKLFEINTTKRKVIYKESFEERNIMNKINNDIEEMNLEILLLNTLIISAVKVQTVIDKFMKNKTYTSIF